MKRLVLLGASGSIGMQTIDVVLQHPDEFEIKALGIGRNCKALEQILQKISVDTVSVQRQEDAEALQKKYPEIHFLSGDSGMEELASRSDYDVLVNALVGFVGFCPTLTAIQHGHNVALANKETLVVGGELINAALEKYNCCLYPVDSEHSAVFQCLQGNRREDVSRLIITASGGAFRSLNREQLKNVTVQQALAHPNWTMGAKITIDSATMMNKGFEVMEAHWLFDMDYDHIDVLMHPESIVHSMVEYRDHSVIAQMGAPDMRLPIQYALSWPERYPLKQEHPLDLAEVGTLHFSNPDYERFPLLKLAYQVGRKGGNLPAVMNSANETANAAFREGKIPFTAIETIIQKTVTQTEYHDVHTVQDLQQADAFGRDCAGKLIKGDY